MLLNLLIVRRLRPSRTRERDLPPVSVLIPARNVASCRVSLPCSNKIIRITKS